jgi:hypothetical protein
MYKILVIQTQAMENKAWPTWNGEGECPEAWRYKFGDTYVHYAHDDETAHDFNNVASIIKGLDLSHNEAWREYVIEAKWYDEEGFSLFLLDTDDFWVERFKVIDSSFNIKKWGQ